MSCSRTFVFFIYHLTLAFLLQKAFGAYKCFSPNSFTTNSDYEDNVISLITNLSTQTHPTGYSQASVGQAPDTVYGHALCTTDMSTTNCQTCVQQAGNEVRTNCPNSKGAIAWNNWYGDCLLKYSDVQFSGQIDNQNKVYYQNPNNAGNPAAFNLQTKGLLLQLSEQGSSSPVLSAAGQLQVKGLQKVYGTAQCTRDLSESDCKQCLDELIVGNLASCCNGKEGGRVLSGSCCFQYETFPFYPA